MPDWLQRSLPALGWIAGAWFCLTLALTPLLRSYEQRHHPLAATVRVLRNLLLPLTLLAAGARVLDAAVAGLTPFATGFEPGTVVKVLESVLWMAGLIVVLSLVKNTALTRREGGHYETRVPKLLIDILRLVLVLVGACFVIAGVWNKDLGGLLTAVGISSIVLGLALQNTLDNVMAGIAVLFEQPFAVGDWIQVGNTTGQVLEMNWRSVRVRTRGRDLVVVPNSVIGKETLINLSRPTKVHGESHVIGFSYDDAPNKVKRVLTQVALATRGILADPGPSVRTINYAAYSIEYQIRYFIDDYTRQQEINDEFMTQVWYAARRANLTIPFPIQTSFEYRMRMPPPTPPGPGRRPVEVLQKIPVFVPLGDDELAALSADAERHEFGRGERIVHQGDPGTTMYVILDGNAVVSLRDEHGGEREVARLARGEFFGEMALLTGEPRSANVTAVDDLAVLVIHGTSLQGIFQRRPALAQEMAEIVEARRQGLRAIAEIKTAPPEQQQRIRTGAVALLSRIQRFLGL